MRLLAAWIVVLGSVTLWAGPVGAAAGDQQRAEAALLADADVPAGFTGGPYHDARPGPVLKACKGPITKADRLVDSSPVARSAFQLDGADGYALIRNTVAVLPNEQKAKRVLKAYSRKVAAQACIQARMDEDFTESGVDATVSVGSFDPELDEQGAVVVQGGADFVGFDGSVRRTAGGTTQDFEYQVALARAGRAVTQLVVVAQGAVPRAEVQRMLQAVLHRMGDG